MATGYVVWDNKAGDIAAGPFKGANANADATSAMRRIRVKTEGKNETKTLSVEAVTV